MSELTAIRQGIADALSASLGESFQVSPWVLGNTTAPSVQVFPADPAATYHRAMQNGHADWTLTVRVLVGLLSDIGAQQKMDALMGTDADGIKAAIEEDRTLGGACQQATVVSVGNVDTYVTSGNQQLLGADWTVQVIE